MSRVGREQAPWVWRPPFGKLGGISLLATILVVDDEPQARLLLASVLQDELGHEVVFAPDGEAAAETYGQIDPDLVITDLVMPQLSGIPMIEHLRAAYPTSKIIAISGKAREQLEDAEAAGAVAALEKPFRRGELVAAVERALAIREPWDPTT